MFPVNIVFDSNAVMDWFMGYMTFYGMKQEAMDEFKDFQAEVLNTISGYKLPVITLDKSTPREAVCKVFENVNTGGVPLTVFELVTATYATRDFDLRKDWVQCRQSICGFGDTLRTDLFDGIDETTFLTTVCLYTSYIDYNRLKANDFDTYFILRAKSLLNLIEKAMGKPVTDRDAENTIEQFGKSLV